MQSAHLLLLFEMNITKFAFIHRQLPEVYYLYNISRKEKREYHERWSPTLNEMNNEDWMQTLKQNKYLQK